MALYYYEIKFGYQTQNHKEIETIYAIKDTCFNFFEFYRYNGEYIMLSYKPEEYYLKLSKILKFEEYSDIIYEKISYENLPNNIKKII